MAMSGRRYLKPRSSTMRAGWLVWFNLAAAQAIKVRLRNET
jgi:hypothetical protein